MAWLPDEAAFVYLTKLTDKLERPISDKIATTSRTIILRFVKNVFDLLGLISNLTETRLSKTYEYRATVKIGSVRIPLYFSG